MNEDKIILDLCGGTAAWSRPYAEAGYDVRIITTPDYDVRLYQPPNNVYGVLAAPPCTYFCRMRMCRGRPTDEQFKEGLAIVDACLRVILVTAPKFWCLENPQGYLKRWLGEPIFKFHPYQFGDPWTKRTWLWGNFVVPRPLFTGIIPTEAKYQWVNDGTNDGLSRTVEKNAITPSGFARAFFEANQ